MMRNPTKQIDYIHDSPGRILLSICLPMVLVSFVQILTTALINNLYSLFVGEVAFTVTGYLSTVVGTFGNIVNSSASAAWIKTAHHYAFPDRTEAKRQLTNSILVIMEVTVACCLVMLIGADWILQLMGIPGEIYSAVKHYYIVSILFYVPIPIASLLLTVANGTSSASRMLLINVGTVAINAFMAVLLLAVLRLEMTGVALLPALTAGAQILLCLVFLKKNGITLKLRGFSPDWGKFKGIIRYTLIIALQNLLCASGYLIATTQANHYLSPDYISVLNVTLPLCNFMNAFITACNLFCPQNYAAGEFGRLRRYFWLSTGTCVAFGVVCFLIFAALGPWYFGRLFENPSIIKMGSQYWFWYGMGHIFLAVIYTVRFFFDAVGMGKLSLLSGLGELIGNLLCAFWLIPKFGHIGRSLSYPLGWFFAAAFLMFAYFLNRRKIYSKKIV